MTFDEWLFATELNPVHHQDVWDAGIAEGRRQMREEVREKIKAIKGGEAMTLIICKEIRRVSNGYIVELRWPYGNEPGGYGEVICKTWEGVLQKLTEAKAEEAEK